MGMVGDCVDLIIVWLMARPEWRGTCKKPHLRLLPWFRNANTSWLCCIVNYFRLMRLHSGDLHLRFASMNTVFCPTGYSLISGEITFFDDVNCL